jgi:hypothetical protein
MDPSASLDTVEWWKLTPLCSLRTPSQVFSWRIGNLQPLDIKQSVYSNIISLVAKQNHRPSIRLAFLVRYIRRIFCCIKVVRFVNLIAFTAFGDSSQFLPCIRGAALSKQWDTLGPPCFRRVRILVARLLKSVHPSFGAHERAEADERRCMQFHVWEFYKNFSAHFSCG